MYHTTDGDVIPNFRKNIFSQLTVSYLFSTFNLLPLSSTPHVCDKVPLPDSSFFLSFERDAQGMEVPCKT